MTFPNFHPCFLIPMDSNSFQIQNPREKMRWLLPFNLMKVVVENILISFENISNSKTLSNSMIFMREDKMTSSKYMKCELEVLKELNSKSHWNYFNLELFGFYSNYFSPKIKYMEIRVKWTPTLENWREINLKSFWYIFKWFLLGVK